MRHLRFSLLFAVAVAAGFLAPASGSPSAAHGEGHTCLLPLAGSCLNPIHFTDVPSYGSFENLRGSVATCVGGYFSYRVAVYIYVGEAGGWWTKPYFDSPLTGIAADGTWEADVTTGGSDRFASRIAAFLIPAGYDPPLLSGAQEFPAELRSRSLGHAVAERSPRTLVFSGYTWLVKSSDNPVGPGPNYFSDAESDVWVDGQGCLHLTLTYRDGRWWATEIYSRDTFGHGRYQFTLATPADTLDRNAVLGLFTWDQAAPQHAYREIDVEFSRWGEESAPNAQYVVQPWETAGNRHRFSVDLQGGRSIHSFDWQENSVTFESLLLPGGQPLASWTYNGVNVPPDGPAQARINLWLLDGEPPAGGQEIEVVIESFRFTAP